jgi:hypothetical protein
VIEEALRHFVSPTHDDWDDKIPAIEFAINNAWQESIQNSPFFLNHGRHPRSPFTVRLKGNVPAAQDFVASMNNAIRRAKECLRLAQQRMKRKADPRRRDITFMIGQQVLLNAKNITLLGATASDKLMPRFIGPFKITERVNEVAYELDLPKYLEIHPVFHVSLLKPYYDGGRIQPPPPPVNVKEGQLGYAVSSIVSHKACHKGRVPKWTYLIQWAGYGAEHNTWEYESSLSKATHALEKMQEYRLSKGLPDRPPVPSTPRTKSKTKKL